MTFNHLSAAAELAMRQDRERITRELDRALRSREPVDTSPSGWGVLDEQPCDVEVGE